MLVDSCSARGASVLSGVNGGASGSNGDMGVLKGPRAGLVACLGLIPWSWCITRAPCGPSGLVGGVFDKGAVRANGPFCPLMFRSALSRVVNVTFFFFFFDQEGFIG